MATITLDNVQVIRNTQPVLDVNHLEVGDGELLVVLGPSGSGKSTLLRAIAGLDSISSGSIRFGGIEMAGVETADREVAMVFQDQALYPFLNVRNNVAFPLKIRKTPAQEVTSRVEAEARVLEISHLLARKPGELGAGHQQLVQAARALVRVPRVFLMDEPLARLDAHLRIEMRQEFRLLQQGYGVTTVFVTNDQQEAMVMADRIAVLCGGVIQQVSPPMELYRSPVSKFVAGFVGDMGFVPGQLAAEGAGYWVSFGGFRLRAWTPTLGGLVGSDIEIGVRPEDIIEDPAGVEVSVGGGYFVGSYGMAAIELATGHTLEMRTDGPPPPPGSTIGIRLRRLHILDTRSGLVLGRVEDGAG